MAEFVVGKCPEINTDLKVFESGITRGSWGLARVSTGGGHTFCTTDFKWVSSERLENAYFTSKEVAEQFAKSYIAHIIKISIAPCLIDKERLRIAFKCPNCLLVHKSTLRFGSWDEAKMIIKRICPKNASYEIFIRLWNGKVSHPSGPIGAIVNLPNYDCKECFGTGEFTLFTSVSPCSTCLPKKI